MSEQNKPIEHCSIPLEYAKDELKRVFQWIIACNEVDDRNIAE